MWGTLAAYLTNYNIMGLRIFFVMALYMITEQNVFIQMLVRFARARRAHPGTVQMYQWPVNWYWVYVASAWFYLISRVGLMVLFYWTWWEWRHVAFGEDEGPAVVPLSALALLSGVTGVRDVVIPASYEPRPKHHPSRMRAELI